MFELSSVLAHYAEVCWGDSGWQDACPFPLIVGAKARVSRLRGYGNAIVAQVAEGFVSSYLDAEQDDFDRAGAPVVIEGDFADLLS